MRYIALTLLLSLTQAFAAFTGNYTLGDLEALHKEGNFTEFMAHARDVRPADRGRHWTEMVQDMAIQLIDQRVKKAEYPEEDFKLIEDLASWPPLKEDEFFQTKRAAFGERYLLSCIEAEKAQEKYSEATSPCLKAIYNFWNNTPNIPITTDIGVRLGEIVRKNASPDDLWSFFTRAANSPAAEFLCKKEALQTALKSKIKKILRKNIDDLELTVEIKSLANSDCWSQVIPGLEKELTSPNKEDAQVAYKVLQGRGLLGNQKKDLFLAAYLLNGPENGEFFNQAWNEFQKMGQDYKRRENILESLKKIDPLPGKVFAIEDTKKRQVLLDNLALNFPEYIDLYAKTCLAYVKGSQSFPNGNPTMECRELLKSAKNTKILNEKVLNELSTQLK